MGLHTLLLGLALGTFPPAGGRPATAAPAPAAFPAVAFATVARAGAGAFTADTVPYDTYGDPRVRRLLRRAREARGRRDTAIASHEVTWRERIYFGVTADRFRRERGLFHQQRAARVRWAADGERTVRWLGVRRRAPVGGAAVNFVEDFDFLDPASDRLFLGGGNWGVHPLADSAVHHYRYRSGDTLRIRLAGRSVTLVEAIVDPREARFDLVAGSLWFDDDSGVLVRAAYRPARDYDLELDEPEEADEVPGLLRPVRAGVDYLVVEYGLQELTWWLPARMAFEGRVELGGLMEFPFQAEWTFEDYAVNRRSELDPGPLPGPEWRRIVRSRTDDSLFGVEMRGEDTVSTTARARDEAGWDVVTEGREGEVGPEEGEDDPGEGGSAGGLEPGEWRRLVVIVPPDDSLATAPELPEPFGRGDRAFSTEELDRLRDRISAAEVPPAGLPNPRFVWGSRLLRYNRVEGPSAGVGLRVPVAGRTDLWTTVRVGVADQEPNVEASLRHREPGGTLAFGAYRRLEPAGDWGAPLGLGNSLNTLLLGYDDGLYYRTTGMALSASRTAGRLRWEGAVFGERHRTAVKGTDVSLPAAFGDDLRPNIRADRAELAGLRGQLRFQTGVDPSEEILAGRLWGEAATGDFDYGRWAASLALTTPTDARWVGALEAGAGTTTGHPPRQRLWFLGGSYTLRGFEAGALEGEAFWMARAEVGRGFGVGWERSVRRALGRNRDEDRFLRAVGFVDAGWAGARSAFGTEDWALGAGLGLSFLDGLLRVDLARALEGDDDWRLHVYSDGIL